MPYELNKYVCGNVRFLHQGHGKYLASNVRSDATLYTKEQATDVAAYLVESDLVLDAVVKEVR